MACSHPRRRSRRAALLAAAAASAALPAVHAGNQWVVTGESGVSAQQLFRGQGGKVYILDKVERNPLQINGHPAWAVEYDVPSNSYRAQEVTTNTFCAGGNVLANGTWAIFGGNKAVTYGGLAATGQGAAPYDDYNGGTAIRLFDPCTDDSCEFTTSQEANMQSERWYPTIETLQDGSLAILGGMRDGGYVNTEYADNPTVEFFPSKGSQIGLNILAETLPCNLYPLTWLLPSGNLLVQSNLGAEVFDWQNNVEYPLDDIPHSVRVYPASGATAMLPLTPANNWTATVLFCGGTNLQPDQWMTSPNWDVASYPADDTCVSITPDVSSSWTDEDSMFEGRSMGQFILLPDGRLFHFNGIATGTAGYGNTSWARGQSYGDNPLLATAYYDPSQPSGSRWQRPADLQNMTVERLYHSSATLLADGSIFNAGSNPNADYVPKGFVDTDGNAYPYPTEYRVEMFYPDYYNKTRPTVTGLPTNFTYGGDYWNLTLTKEQLLGNSSNLDTVKVNLYRTGYSTHAMNMGMRMVQLNSTYTADSSTGGGTLHVAQAPPNPSIIAPGPALLYVVVNGIPAEAVDVMVGDGVIGNQTVYPVQAMPGKLSASASSAASASSSTSKDDASAASRLLQAGRGAAVAAAAGLVAALAAVAL